MSQTSIKDIPFVADVMTDKPIEQILASNETRLEKLSKGLQAVADLMGESEGVSGLHLNGEIAKWDDLLTGSWLEDFHEAMNELIDMRAEEIERDEMQHEIKMTDDPHYAAHHRQLVKQAAIDEHGIDEN